MIPVDFSKLLVLVLPLIGWGIYLTYRLGQLTIKIDTMWDFHVRRAKVEMIERGWGTIHSPMEITAEGFDAVLPFLDHFFPFFAETIKKYPSITDAEMMFRMEQALGELMLNKVCIPQSMKHGACLLLVILACKRMMEPLPADKEKLHE